MLLSLILGVVAAGFLALFVLTQQKASRFASERDDKVEQLKEVRAELEEDRVRLERANADLRQSETRRTGLTQEVSDLTSQLDESSSSLRKRTELADAQALQIDALSGERDELRQQLNTAEEQIVTLAARPGVVVGDLTSGDSANAEMLWELEVARSERSWRNSVSVNPVNDPSPFESAEDPVRQAVEIEAAALREDVGAYITIDWQAQPIQSPARRLLVVRVAQEMLASASRAPGAARLVISQVGEGDGELKMEFEADGDDTVINLIPPQISNDLIDIRNEGQSVTVRAE